MPWQEVTTQYVIDRIEDADFDTDPAYIHALLQIEAYLLRGGPQSFAEGIAWRELCRRYPADVRQIQQELRPVSGKALKGRTAAQAKESRWESRLRSIRGARESAEQRAWAKWGGRP